MSRIRLFLENVEDAEDARVGAFFAVRGDFGVFYATDRRLYRALRLEEKADRRAWEDDD